MRWRREKFVAARWFGRLLVAGATATALVGVAVPASAEAVSGSCSGGGFNGNATTFFTFVAAANANRVTSFQWMMQHPSSTASKNNTNIRHKEDRTLATDPTLFSYNSPDNLKIGTLYSISPSTTVQLPTGRKQYTNFEFIFDNNNGADPKCTARTSTFT